MESKFKIGDRVKWTKYGGSSWQNCTITEVSPRFDGLMGYMLTNPHPEFGDGWIAENELDLVETNPESKALSLLRKIIDLGGYGWIGKEAKQILDELDSVDADLVEARRVVEENGSGGIPYSKGNDDWRPAIKIALAAIKRGRELERCE